jgi:hypothetical protein
MIPSKIMPELSPRNGNPPVAISYSTTPNCRLKQSVNCHLPEDNFDLCLAVLDDLDFVGGDETPQIHEAVHGGIHRKKIGIPSWIALHWKEWRSGRRFCGNCSYVRIAPYGSFVLLVLKLSAYLNLSFSFWDSCIGWVNAVRPTDSG